MRAIGRYSSGLLGEHPRTLERDGLPGSVRQLLVGLEEPVEHVLVVPDLNLQPLRAALLLGQPVQPAPRDQKRLVRLVAGDRADEASENLRADLAVLALDLHDEGGAIQAKWSTAGQDVDTLVRPFRRDSARIAESAQDFRDQAGELVTLEVLGEVCPNPVADGFDRDGGRRVDRL